MQYWPRYARQPGKPVAVGTRCPMHIIALQASQGGACPLPYPERFHSAVKYVQSVPGELGG